MRQIKFRMWSNIEKKFIERPRGGNVLISEINPPIYTLDQNDNFIYNQFTGLHDKNGKEIYEGDILKTDFGDICTVKFDMGFYFIDTKEDYESVSLFEWCNEMSEIIGNIHETPELLEAK